MCINPTLDALERFVRGKCPPIGVVRGVHHREQLTHGRPLLDIEGELLVDDVLIDRGAIDHAGDRDELFAGGVRLRANPRDQQLALHPVRTGTATPHDPGRREREHGPDKHDDDRELQHTDMVGLRP